MSGQRPGVLQCIGWPPTKNVQGIEVEKPYIMRVQLP